MSEKRNKSTGRTYEYDKAYLKRPEQREANAARKRARRELESEGRVKPFDGKDVNHKNSKPTDSSRKNLEVLPKGENRGRMKNGKRV